MKEKNMAAAHHAEKGRNVSGHKGVSAGEPDDSVPMDFKGTVYTCPMHPEVRSAEPGDCPKCGMHLVPRAEAGACRA